MEKRLFLGTATTSTVADQFRVLIGWIIVAQFFSKRKGGEGKEEGRIAHTLCFLSDIWLRFFAFSDAYAPPLFL